MGREPWSSGYGRRLTFRRPWVQIPVAYTGWTFFTLICCKLVLIFVWKRPKINEKEARDDYSTKLILSWQSVADCKVHSQWRFQGAITKKHFQSAFRSLVVFLTFGAYSMKLYIIMAVNYWIFSIYLWIFMVKLWP